MADITSAVLEELTASCAECRIASDIIDKPSFACYPESPTYVTYRARLRGTSEADSGSLISLIEDWVSGGASVVVNGVLMKVDSECSVAISSLSEKCSPPTTDSTTSSNMTTTDSTTNSGTAPSTETTASVSSHNTTAIIGGVVAVVIVLIIAITVIIALVMKNRRGDLSLKKADK